jgi:hypothetical protein
MAKKGKKKKAAAMSPQDSVPKRGRAQVALSHANVFSLWLCQAFDSLFIFSSVLPFSLPLSLFPTLPLSPPPSPSVLQRMPRREVHALC